MNSIEQIKAAVERLSSENDKKGAELFGAIGGALTEIASALTDLVAVAETYKTEEPESDDGERAEMLANMIAGAIRSVRIESPIVNVEAPSVTVTPTFNVPSPVINNEINVPPVRVEVPPAQIVREASPVGTEWEFEITHNGMNSSNIKARKVK